MSLTTPDEVPAKAIRHANVPPTFRKRLAASRWILLASLLSLITLFLTARSYLEIQSDLGAWGCRMSWMSPNYVRLAGPSGMGLKGLERKYALWLYREGGLQPDVQPLGMPVLFIPGNSGSFKQVRSIASSAAHQFHERSQRSGSAIGFVDDHEESARWQELDFFAVDFNEEFSAFHPNTLRDQSLYVSNAIQYILDLYPAGHPASRKILLVPHSMGGIVARHTVTRPNTTSVSAIITMSTPHMIPPVTFERGMQELYDEIESYWKAWSTVDTKPVAQQPPSVLPVLVSICGGTADTQISSDSCAVNTYRADSDVIPHQRSDRVDKGTFSVFTTGMEGVWTGVDHQAMVWCDQIRRTVATTLLDMSTTNHDRMNATSADLRVELSQKARRRLLGERTAEELAGMATEDYRLSRADVTEITPEQQAFKHTGSRQSVFVVKVPRNATGMQVIGNMRINGLGRAGGSGMTIHLGAANAKSFQTSLSLSTLRVLPKSPGISDHSGPREAFPLQGEGVRDDEVMTYGEATIKPVDHERQLVLKLDGPAWGSIALLGDWENSPWKPIKRSQTFHNMAESSLILHELRIRRPRGCSASASQTFSTIVEHVSSDPGSRVESRMYPRVDSRALLHTHITAAPYIRHSRDVTEDSTKAGLSVNVWQDPDDTCGVQAVSVRVNWVKSLGLMVMRYRMTVLAWTIGLGALVVSAQYRQYRHTGVFPRFIDTLGCFSRKPLVVLSLSLATACLLQASPVSGIVPNPEDYLLGVPEWFSAFLVFPVLGLSYVCLLVSHFAISALTLVFRLCLSRTRVLFLRSSEDIQHFRPRHMTSILVLSLLVKVILPHQFAFLVAFMVQLLNVSSCAQASVAPNRPALYHSLLLLLFWLLPAHGAVLFVWVRNLLVLIEKRPPTGILGGMRGSSGFSDSTFLTGEDHEIWHVLAVLIIVEVCSAGKTLDISARYRPFCFATEASLLVFATAAFLIGSRHFYAVVESVQLFMFVQAAWFLAPSLIARFRHTEEQ